MNLTDYSSKIKQLECPLPKDLRLAMPTVTATVESYSTKSRQDHGLANLIYDGGPKSNIGLLFNIP